MQLSPSALLIRQCLGDSVESFFTRVHSLGVSPVIKREDAGYMLNSRIELSVVHGAAENTYV